MAQILHGFPALTNSTCSRLILGSMPGSLSLLHQQYYAHPRNLFWDFMEEILDIPRQLDYQDRCEKLVEAGIALWDVLGSCARPGSLDSDIVPSSIQANDFNGYYERHGAIAAIYFNGAKAEQVYKKQVLPFLSNKQASIPTHRLPSTSPANASILRVHKLQAWRVISQQYTPA